MTPPSVSTNADASRSAQFSLGRRAILRKTFGAIRKSNSAPGCTRIRQVRTSMNSSSTRRQEAIVGLFVLIAAALLIITVFSLTGFFNRGDVLYRAFFKNAGGLRPGGEVRYAGGPPVGTRRGGTPDPKDTSAYGNCFSREAGRSRQDR